MSNKQKTLKAPFTVKGTGLHSGLKVTMNILPAPADSGIVFKRVDLEGQPEIQAIAENVTDTSRSTTIARGEAKVSTIEHLMAALWSMGVDNAVVEVDGPEVPIMDGSAREYAENINRVGLEEQEAFIQYYNVTETIRYVDEVKNTEIVILPDDEFSV